MIKVAPSILSSDFSHLAEEIQTIQSAGADMVHIDVMDGSFVPNITIGSPVVKSLRNTTNLDFDVHLMIEHPETQIDAFVDAGADIVTFHVEATHHAHRVIQQIKSRGVRAGIAMNPGFGGQRFIDSQLDKVHMLYHTIEDMGYECDIEVDGGINAKTSELVREAGANILVAGSAVYGADDIQAAIDSIRG